MHVTGEVDARVPDTTEIWPRGPCLRSRETLLPAGVAGLGGGFAARNTTVACSIAGPFRTSEWSSSPWQLAARVDVAHPRQQDSWHGVVSPAPALRGDCVLSLAHTRLLE